MLQAEIKKGQIPGRRWNMHKLYSDQPQALGKTFDS